jgi:hypothetical protein
MPRAVHVALAAHAANPPRFRERIDVSLQHAGDGGLVLSYGIRGLNLDLHVPTPHVPAPADALWSTTCCELFVAPAGAAGYREFNFSPSGQWAAYDFSGYRERSATAVLASPPTLTCQRTEDRLQLDVTLPHTALPHGPTFVLGLAAILQTQEGHLGYWALAHMPGKPDFHRREGFLLRFGPHGLN